MSLGSVFDSTPLEYRKISPGSKERADAPTQQMENFMDIVDLKQLMERALDHFVPPICAFIRRKGTSRTLLLFRRLTHDPQRILPAVCGLCTCVELGLKIRIVELRVAPFADAKPMFHDPQFALRFRSKAPKESWLVLSR